MGEVRSRYEDTVNTSLTEMWREDWIHLDPWLVDVNMKTKSLRPTKIWIFLQ